jgi:2-keto-4-pentenoate hydratase/2-oxohepta-3-ene-1,7-dioic acid hydratase in catechol pathway
MDFELELACVIGTPGRDISPSDALSHIFGFTIFNDFSARDVQVIERPLNMGAAKSKDFDTGNALGPWIVTTDEIGDPQALQMEARVNGVRWGGGSSSAMYHTFADIVSYISRDETLRGGEVIASGTVPTGCGLELGRFLSPGDVVELEIERIGVLRNRIVRTS